MTLTSGSDTTQDAFLGGLLTLEQPAKGYRAGVDPVLLAASVQATAGQTVLELGCGTGAAMLCLATRVSGLVVHGVELQPEYANLCRTNAAANGIDAMVWTSDLRALPEDVRARTYDHVIANPPYFDRGAGNASEQPDRDIAFRGDTSISDWVDAATRRLKPKGWLTLIQKADRLPDLLRAIDDRLGTIIVTPIAGRAGRNADRVLLLARKGGRAPFRLTAPVILHVGDVHSADAQDYRPEISAVLRSGAALTLPS